jgi:hypothetical protein
MVFLRKTYGTSVPCMLILLAYVGGHICVAFKSAERKVEGCENMIVIVIVGRSCTNILKFVKSSISLRSSRIKDVSSSSRTGTRLSSLPEL